MGLGLVSRGPKGFWKGTQCLRPGSSRSWGEIPEPLCLVLDPGQQDDTQARPWGVTATSLREQTACRKGAGASGVDAQTGASRGFVSMGSGRGGEGWAFTEGVPQYEVGGQVGGVWPSCSPYCGLTAVKSSESLLSLAHQHLPQPLSCPFHTGTGRDVLPTLPAPVSSSAKWGNSAPLTGL